MTVETSTRKQTFSGGQSDLEFSFRTLISNPEYIKVLVKLISTGEETNLTYSTHYSVSVNSDGVGGVVTVSPTYSTSYNYVVYRETVAVQNSDYDDFNQFPADTVENDLDRAILIQQEQAEDISRTLRYPIGTSATDAELPSPEADAFIAWDPTGSFLVNKEIPDPSTLSKASNLDATTGTDDANYMTPAKVKLEVENPGTVSIPASNIAVVSVTKGGTNISVYVQGDTLYASAAGVLSRLAKNSSSTRYLSNTGSSNNPAWAQVALATGVSGVLPIANGGTGVTTSTAAINALLPTQTGNAGKMLITDGSACSWTSTASSTSISPYSNGTTYTEVTAATSRSTSSITYTKLKELSPTIRGGNATVTWDHAAVSPGEEVATKLYINDIAVGSEKTTTTSGTVSESNVSLIAGDVIQIYGKRNGSGNLSINNLKLKCNNPITLQEAI